MAVVLDTGPLIKNTDLRKLGEVFYTTSSVLQEVRDKSARKALTLKLEEITTTEPTQEDIEFVLDFARKTGDIRSLSNTDVTVLALACKLHREAGGSLNSDPNEIRPAQNRAKLDEWVTPENFKANDGRVCLVSYDFSIQNVAIQIGVKLVTSTGIEIKFLKRWAQKCSGCGEICQDSEKEFCPSCGNHTLYKISYSVDIDGKTQFYEPKNKKNNLAGTVFPIPNPKGGKNCEDIILREDQLYLMGGRQNKWNWKKPSVYDAESVEMFGFSLKSKSGYKYGPSRKNPNEPHKKSKKKI
jgi:RNA-binding protein NOB1